MLPSTEPLVYVVYDQIRDVRQNKVNNIKSLSFLLNITDVEYLLGDFPDRLVVKTSSSNTGGEGSIPGQRAMTSHLVAKKKKKKSTNKPKQKQYCKTFKKIVHIKKNTYICMLIHFPELVYQNK